MYFLIEAGPLPRAANWVSGGSLIDRGQRSEAPVYSLDDMARAVDEAQGWLLEPMTEWRALPDDAPRDLLSLNEWLRARGDDA